MRLLTRGGLERTAVSLFLAAAALPSLVSATTTSDEKAPRPLQHDEVLLRRHAEIEKGFATQAPIGVRKMSGDPSEKFYPEYWVFEGMDAQRDTYGVTTPSQSETPDDATFQKRSETLSNLTAGGQFLAPLLLHSNAADAFFLSGRAYARQVSKRGYQCPSGFNSCASIGYNDTCCASGLTCQVIPNTGIGVVGCCPSNDCTGSVSSCDTARGYSSCPQDQANSNGCCSPGFVCDGLGCVQGSVTTVTTTIPLTTVVSSSSTSVVGATTQTITSTQTQVATSSGSGQSTVVVTQTTPTSTVVISAHSVSTDTTVVVETVTVASAPVRPTSVSGSLTTITTTTSSQQTLGMCPTGFYPCSAFYRGGCCQVGRNCDTTDCPSTVSATVETGNVVTIVVVTGSGVTTISEGFSSTTTATDTSSEVVSVASVTTITSSPGSTTTQSDGSSTCPTGWFTCGANEGGGCCPTGYACGATCSATQTGEPKSVAKIPLDNGGVVARGIGYGLLSLAGIATFGMVLL